MSVVNSTTNSARRYPKQLEFTFPLLNILEEVGGQAQPKEIYEEVGLRMGLSNEEINAKDENNNFYLFHRHLRWLKQSLQEKGLVETPKRGVWALSERGKEFLKNSRPGVMINVFYTPSGDCFLGTFQTVAEAINDGQVNLHFTSPPYPLNTPLAYGNVTSREYVDWFLPLAEQIYRTLADDGSFILNIGSVYRQGVPVLSTHFERLVIALEDKIGFKVAGKFYWDGNKPPKTNWVTKDRVRVKNSVEEIYWFSKTPFPKANNRNILKPYSESYIKAKQHAEKTGDFVRQRRPNLSIAPAFNVDNGGAIPGNILTFPYCKDDKDFVKSCYAHGIGKDKIHNARMPIELPEWFIKFLTNTGDLVADLFAGTGTVGKAASNLGRRFLISDRSYWYLKQAHLRFPDATTMLF